MDPFTIAALGVNVAGSLFGSGKQKKLAKEQEAQARELEIKALAARYGIPIDEARRIYLGQSMYDSNKFGYQTLSKMYGKDRPGTGLGEAPKYEIPKEVTQYLAQMQQMGREGLPGENLIRDQLKANFAEQAGSVARGADTSAGYLGALSGLANRTQQSIADLGIQSAQIQRQNQINAIGSKLIGADYTDKAWEYNFNIPWQRGQNRADAYEDMARKMQGSATDMGYASNQNFVNNLSSIAGFSMMNPNMNFGNFNLGNLFGNKQNVSMQGTGMGGNSEDRYKF